MTQNPSGTLLAVAGIPQSGIVPRGDDFHSRFAP
jgi:hypothetical protein